MKYFTLVLVLLNLHLIQCRIGDTCTTPNGEDAVCRRINDCQILYNAVTTNNQRQVEFLQKSFCGFQNDRPLVCCGSHDNFVATPRSNLIPDRSSCGIQSDNKVLGGETTDLDEFPWMALLQYKKAGSNDIKSSCGGVLISKRYVLTAAHCVTGEIRRAIGNLVNVRLGEWNTDTNPDCTDTNGYRECNDPHVNVPVDEIVSHPGYNTVTRVNDIALVRLARDVRITDYVKPICLPEANEAASIGDNLVVAGWGQTENARNSPFKLKVSVPVVSKNTCSTRFASFNLKIEDSQLCAGGVKNKDSCKGDSGGPLMRQTRNDSSQWYAEGIVSFGAECGRENWPAVYTRITSFLPWIYRNVR